MLKLAKRLSVEDKKNIVKAFTSGDNVSALSQKYSCSKLTIIRNLKQNIGENLYKELSIKNKSLNQVETIKKNNDENIQYNIKNKSQKNELNDKLIVNNNVSEYEFTVPESFMEITPLNYEIKDSSRKEFSSVPISQIALPKIVYIIVDKNIELEIKLLKDYLKWDFLPNSDLNRKTIEIYSDIKVAKRFCKKEQKVIKVPNTDIFRIVAPILISKGISRIVSSEHLIAL